MNPLNEILTWTRRLPDWQRDAVRRLFQQENGLTAADYDDLYALLKAGRGLPNPKNLSPVPLDASHLPTNIQSGQSVTLIEMRDLENVNRIALSQTLSFSKSGITVIYGGNGSGKSGYVRVMKQACRSRDSSEPVYANVNNPVCDRLTPTAKFRIDHQGVEQEIVWKYKDTPPDILSAVSIFDARCARSYLPPNRMLHICHMVWILSKTSQTVSFQN